MILLVGFNFDIIIIVVGNKFLTKKTEIAAAGNKPEDWKVYIDETKLNIKDNFLDEKRKCDIISYMYYTAFKVCYHVTLSISIYN